MSNMGVGSWPARRARMLPESVALRQADRVLTYRELTDRVRALSAALFTLGVRPGDRVAYLGANDIATFETLFASANLGAIFVPLNTRLAAAELDYLLGDCTPSILIHGPDMAAIMRDITMSCPTVSLVAAALGDHSYGQLLADGESATAPDVEVALEHDAVILYTSGTTGKPKGAVLTHGNLTWNVFNQLAHLDVLSTDVALCTAPLFHATGLGQVSLPTMFKGGTVVVAPKFDPAWMLRTIGELRITGFSGVPTMLQMLCEHPDWETADVSSLRYVNFGGSPVPEDVAVAWLSRGVPLLQGYGMTEASPGVFMALPGGAVDRPISAGVTHFFTDVALLQADGELSVPPGTGELLVRGPNVFRGYWNREQDTADSFIDGWFRSGDAVRVEDDGWSYVVDRVKDMLISGGENIYPAEIEDLINQLPEVVESAVVGTPDAAWGEVGRVYVVLAPGAELSLEQLHQRLEGRLARYKLPKYLTIVAALPRTATGKIRKNELRDAASPSAPPIEENA